MRKKSNMAAIVITNAAPINAASPELSGFAKMSSRV
jgi:hypothetical protein